MSEMTTTTETGPPKQFGMTMPGWWPRIEPVMQPGDRAAADLPPEQAEPIRRMLASADIPAGTRCVSVMMTVEDEPRPFGLMYVNHSDDAGRVMSGMLGVQATPDELADLHSVGNLEDVDVSLTHFDTVGAVSCVTARRAQGVSGGGTTPTLIRAYLIPEPKSFRAALVLYMTAYQEAGVEPFCDLCDQVTATFTWRW